jgi:hypothetical protein
MGGWSLVGRFGAMARVAIFALSIVGAALAEIVSSGAQAPDGSKPSTTVELAVTPPDQTNQQAPSPATAAANPPAQSSGSGNDAASPAQTAAIAPSEAQHQPLDSVGPARAAAEPGPSVTAAPASGDDTPADSAAPSEDEKPDTAPNERDHKPSDAAAPASSGAAAPEQAAADPIVAAIREKLKDPALRKSANSDDLAALADFYAERSNPLWITSMGFSARAQSLIGEIHDADDWGLSS